MAHERDGLQKITGFVQSRQGLYSTRCLTLLERTVDSTGRVIAQIVFKQQDERISNLSKSTKHNTSIQGANWQDNLATVDVLQWNYDVIVQVTLQLRRFEIQATSSTPQKISHTSALFIHRLVYESPLQEIHLYHVEFKEQDWSPMETRNPLDIRGILSLFASSFAALGTESR
ncbi:hypothetical protein BGZ82_005705 [Podila clonocystis]|nr:hypothetical protein BGZ82_005705 [Podila clonocystis]